MRKALLLLAFGLAAVVAAFFNIAFLGDEGPAESALYLAVSMALLVPLVLPLLVLRSRWYRLTALICGLLALVTYTALILVGTFFLLPSAVIVLLSILTPQPR